MCGKYNDIGGLVGNHVPLTLKMLPWKCETIPSGISSLNWYDFSLGIFVNSLKIKYKWIMESVHS